MAGTARELRQVEVPRSFRELTSTGVTRAVLRSRRWRRTERGFYLPADTMPESPGQRIAEAWAGIASGDGVVGGWAAGYLHRASWLDGRSRDSDDLLPVDGIGPRRLDRPTVRYRATRVSDEDTCLRYGIRVTKPVRTAFDGARWAPTLSEAVVFVDAMLTQAKVDPRELLDYCRCHPRMGGVRQAREAIALGRAGVRSPWESILRVCYLREAGLPEPLLNVPLFDGETFLGQPDLFDPEAAFAAEFDGKQHRDREQHRRDNVREEKLESAGVTVSRCDSLDLTRHRPQFIARLQDGYRRGRTRDRSRDRWTRAQPDWWGYR